MAEYLSNAFSLQMICANAKVGIVEISKDSIPFDGVISVIGHQDIADMLGVKVNRVNTRLQEGDILYVAQYCGGRLPEGCVNIPKDAVIKFYKITVKYIEKNMPEPELWVYVWNISHITRDAPDEIIVSACGDPDYKIPKEYDTHEEGDDETYEVARYYPDEFAEMVNDEMFDDSHHYIRFIKAK